MLAWKNCLHCVVHKVELWTLNHKVPMWKEYYLQIIKSIHRNRMKIETENNQLYIHYNMPDLENCNPRPAVLAWLVI